MNIDHPYSLLEDEEEMALADLFSELQSASLFL